MSRRKRRRRLRPWVIPSAILVAVLLVGAPLVHADKQTRMQAQSLKNTEIAEAKAPLTHPENNAAIGTSEAPLARTPQASADTSSTTPVKKTATSFEDVKDKPMQTMYVANDTVVKTDTTAVSATVQKVKQGDKVSLVDVDGDKAEVLTDDGKAGYVSVNTLATDKRSVFTDENKTMYIAKDNTDVKTSPYEQGTTTKQLNKNDEVTVTGTNDSGFTEVSDGKNTGYVESSLLMKEKDIPKPTPEPQQEVQPAAATLQPAAVNTWSGQKLSPSAGSVIGPSGKETYYNLDMSGCVNVMRRLGNNDAYWVRDDGAKMLGVYVMCAANLEVHPRGSIVQSSLGAAIVVDTGGFAVDNPSQLDMAVTW